MTPALAVPVEYMSPTGSVSSNFGFSEFIEPYDDLVEEPMDYTPIAFSELCAPDLEEEVWVDDDSGPMGY
jgi:hypothetical protein